MVFHVETLDRERTRITKILRNNGYYKFNKDYLVYEADTEINTEQDSNTEVEDNTPSTPEDTTNPGNTTDTETETPSHPSGLTPNSQGIIILDEDTNGDGLLSRAEAGADGFDYYKVCYNPDNTTYLVNIFDGSIVHLLESFTDAMGEQAIYAGRTPEDTEWIENHRFD